MEVFKYAKKIDGKIRLTSSGSLDLSPTTFDISQEVCNWFADFLARTKNNTMPTAYEASRDDSGNMCLKNIRDGGFVSDISFSAEEIPIVLRQIKKIDQVGGNPEI